MSQIDKVYLGLFLLLCLSACSSEYPTPVMEGKQLPSFVGQSLNENQVQVPQNLNQEPALLFFGYLQEAQFDIDRWMIGIEQIGLDIPYYEIPTVRGFLPGLFRSRINQGMRDGIPSALWDNVITVYQDNHIIQNFFGNEKPANAYVVLIDSDSRIRFFHNTGFSAAHLGQLQKQVQALTQTQTPIIPNKHNRSTSSSRQGTAAPGVPATMTSP